MYPEIREIGAFILYRRIQSSMGMQTGMGVPTTQPDTQSPSPLEQMQRTDIDRGTQVGDDILDVRPEEEEQGTSNDHRKTRGGLDRCHNATAPPPEVDRLGLQVWRIGCGNT